MMGKLYWTLSFTRKITVCSRLHRTHNLAKYFHHYYLSLYLQKEVYLQVDNKLIFKLLSYTVAEGNRNWNKD